MKLPVKRESAFETMHCSTGVSVSAPPYSAGVFILWTITTTLNRLPHAVLRSRLFDILSQLADSRNDVPGELPDSGGHPFVLVFSTSRFVWNDLRRSGSHSGMVEA